MQYLQDIHILNFSGGAEVNSQTRVRKVLVKKDDYKYFSSDALKYSVLSLVEVWKNTDIYLLFLKKNQVICSVI